MQVRGAPKFIKIAGSHANPEGGSVDLLFDAVDGQRYMIELAPGIIPALLTAIAGHASELRATHGEPPIQPLPVKELSISIAENGAAALVLHSESELKTALSFSPDQAQQVRAILQELDELLSRKVQ